MRGKDLVTPPLTVEAVHFVGLREYSHSQNGGTSVRSLPARKLFKTKNTPRKGCYCFFAPRVGIEPTTKRLTVACSTTELPRNI